MILENKIRKHITQCLADHRLIQQGDVVMVGLSGGKDSFSLLYFLKEIQKKSHLNFSLLAVTLDGGLIGLDDQALRAFCTKLDVPFHLERKPVFEIVSEKKDEDSTFCSLCAKMRRGILYRLANQLGASKIALGHHLDDAIETLFLNMFYSGQLSSLPPCLESNSGFVPVIRPMLYVAENDLQAFSLEKKFKTLGCACPVCPTHPHFEGMGDLKRNEMKSMVQKLSERIPNFRSNVKNALMNLKTDRFFTKESLTDLNSSCNL